MRKFYLLHFLSNPPTSYCRYLSLQNEEEIQTHSPNLCTVLQNLTYLRCFTDIEFIWKIEKRHIQNDRKTLDINVAPCNRLNKYKFQIENFVIYTTETRKLKKSRDKIMKPTKFSSIFINWIPYKKTESISEKIK